MKYRSVINKIIITIIMILVSQMFMNNRVLAAPTAGITSTINSALKENTSEDWDTFYLRFTSQLSANASTDNLSDKDLDRMIAGPTEDERYSGALYIDVAALEYPQERAREIKEARVQGGGSTNSRRKYKTWND